MLQMPMITPQQIATKAENAYPKFLKSWVRDDEDSFFPYRIVRVNLKVDPKDISGTIAANEKLLSHSKPKRKWGYTVHREQKNKRDFGNNRFPKKITIDTRDDLLRLAKKVDEFTTTRHVVDRVRAELPQLKGWLVKHVGTLYKHAEPIEKLISVAQYFMKNPWPDCFLRQIPLQIDTKFIKSHSAVLQQWLNRLLPTSAYDDSEKKFSRRYGLRDGQPHQALRLLDQQFQQELGLPFDELSLPLKVIASLPVQNATAIIVENEMNLFILPPYHRGIGIQGKGNAVILLERLKWLETNRLLYWGDIDVDGLLILSRLRNLFPHVESIMMDLDMLQCHEEHSGEGNKRRPPPAPTNLTPGELAAFEFCAQHNRRLEQEKIPQNFVDQAFEKASSPKFVGEIRLW